MKKFGAVDPELTPDVEAPAETCALPDCRCRGESGGKTASDATVRAAILQLDADFRRVAAEAAKTKIN